MIKLVDTHAHLYWESYKEDLDQVLQRAIDAGVSTIINVGVDVELSKKALEQVETELSNIPGIEVFSTIGIHPHEAVVLQEPKVLEENIRQLEEIYRSNPKKVIGIGECGLDFLIDRNDIYPNIHLSEDKVKDLQRKLFQAQIDLAKKLNLPLIVHCRDDRSKDPQNSDAWDEVLQMVGGHLTILHCYSGLLTTTNKVLQTPNLYVSFAATLTYPKNEYLREAAKLLPQDRIVLETDCPFLPPQSMRGTRNEPANVLETAKILAEVKQLSLDTVADKTTENVAHIFAF